MTETYDAIIIGGGIMGCSTALQLAEAWIEGRSCLKKGKLVPGRQESPQRSFASIIQTK